MSEDEKTSQKSMICMCGFSENIHHKRHKFTGNIPVTMLPSGGFLIEVENYYSGTKSGNCTMPQCGRNKYMHDTGIFQHPFKGEEHKYREINFAFFPNTVCLVENCGLSYEQHNESGAKHLFRTEIHFSEKSEHDLINIFSIDGLKIEFEWDKDKKFIQFLHK